MASGGHRVGVGRMAAQEIREPMIRLGVVYALWGDAVTVFIVIVVF